jgi:hypothetical protein
MITIKNNNMGKKLKAIYRHLFSLDYDGKEK